MNVKWTRSVSKILNGDRYALSWIPQKVYSRVFFQGFLLSSRRGTIWGAFNGDFVSTRESLQQNNDG